MEYQKINTLFMRDEKNIIIPNKFCKEEFYYLKNCPFECTEKIDGCLWWGTRIQMADGTVKLIKDVKKGDLIVGYDVDKEEIKEVEVQGVAKKPAAGTWVKIQVTHKGINKGNSYGNVICTFDHKIWTTKGYKEAYTLEPGDIVLSIRRDLQLTPIQKSILTGKMLGDGTLIVCKNQNFSTAHIEFGHTIKGVTDWTLIGLQEIAGTSSIRTSGYDSTIYVGTTKNFSNIYSEFINWITEEGKQVPESIFLDPISIAFWYMDDGSLSHSDGQEDRVRFATNGFNMQSCKYLQRELLKFGIESEVYNYKGNTICLNCENAEKLFLLVAPYICKEYNYKLPERYRDITPFIPKSSPTQYHKLIVPQEVVKVTKENKSYVRWDLQTETHNFFTTTCLVHNTNIRIELDFGETVSCEYKGRTDKAVIPTHLLEKLKQLFDNVDWKEIFPTVEKGTKVTLFGEGYGTKIQSGGNYIKDGVNFILFDIRVGNWWLNREACEAIAYNLYIDIVPIIGYKTILEAIEYVKKGFKSVIAENKDYDAEGLVLKTPFGLQFRNGERIILKIKTCDFVKFKAVYGDNPNPEQPVNPKYNDIRN